VSTAWLLLHDVKQRIFVMTGLVPVISIEVAEPCHDHRDRRVKPGDDE